ncbi:hypothetical protein BDV93DRAFT_361578 [Ceratobasidium sp. AG-I]|nr:hypothetical protein BDV93DRAFT_361578 [Ceratobasidium sp. AG-I]
MPILFVLSTCLYWKFLLARFDIFFSTSEIDFALNFSHFVYCLVFGLFLFSYAIVPSSRSRITPMSPCLLSRFISSLPLLVSIVLGSGVSRG